MARNQANGIDPGAVYIAGTSYCFGNGDGSNTVVNVGDRLLGSSPIVQRDPAYFYVDGAPAHERVSTRSLLNARWEAEHDASTAGPSPRSVHPSDQVVCTRFVPADTTRGL